MKRYFILFVVFLIATACNQKDNKTDVEKVIKNEKPVENAELQPAVFEIKTFVEDNGWGYDIYRNNEKYIHQPNIPAVNGLHVFVSEADALKVAELMVEKMQGGMAQPTISVEELESLQIEIK